MENLEEVQTLRKAQTSNTEPRWNRKHEETDQSNETETVLYKTPIKQRSRTNGFTGEVYQTFSEELTPIFLKLIQKIAEKGTLLSLPYEATITVILIPQKVKIIDQHYWWTHSQKFSTIYEQTEFNNTLKGHVLWLSGIYPRDAKILQYTQINPCKTPY